MYFQPLKFQGWWADVDHDAYDMDGCVFYGRRPEVKVYVRYTYSTIAGTQGLYTTVHIRTTMLQIFLISLAASLPDACSFINLKVVLYLSSIY